MDIWLVLTILLSTVILIDYLINTNNTKINMVTVFIVLLLSTLVGLRGEMGQDYQSYIDIFYRIPAFVDKGFDAVLQGSENFRIEPLYILIISIFKSFIPIYNVYIFCQTLGILVLVIWSLSRIKAPINIGLYIFFFNYYLNSFGQQRMGIAYALCFLASTFFVERQFRSFFVTVGISSVFHYVSVFLLLAMFLKYVPVLNLQLNKYKKVNLTNTNIKTKHLDVAINHKNLSISSWYLKAIILFIVVIIISLYIINFKTIAVFISTNSFLSSFRPIKTLTGYILKAESEVLPTRESAIRGFISYVILLFTLYFRRKFWLNPETGILFSLLTLGWIFWIFNYDLPWAAHRVRDLYWSNIIGLGALVTVGERKVYPIATIMILVFSIYSFYSQIARGIGPYVPIQNNLIF